MPNITTTAQPGFATSTHGGFNTRSPVAGPGQGIGLFNLGGLLARQLAMREAMQAAQLDAIRQQMAMARERAWMERRQADMAHKLQKRGLLRGPKALPSLGRADTSKMDEYAKASRMAEALAGPGTLGALGQQNPYGLQQLTGMIGAIGPQAAHQGMMQTGRLMAGMAGQVGAMNTEEAIRQQQLQGGSLGGGGQGFAKGGRVPSTGTYKLHAGEVVVPTKAADVMFPYAQGGGPARSSSAPRASYQGGSMGLEDIARGVGYGAGQLGAGLTSIHDLIRNLSRQFGAGATGLGTEAQPETITPEPLPSGTPMGPPPQAEYQDLGIRGLRESVGEAGERKFELQGAPGEAGTDREKLSRLDDEAARWDREADYHEAKRNKILSFIGGDPSRMNPEAQRMLRERTTLAQQFRQREMDYRKRADALRKDLMTTETQKDITAIAATGDIERERTKAMATAQVEARKAGESLYSDLSSIVMSARTEANPEAARGAVMMRLQPYRGYIAQLAAKEGAEDPEAAADTIIQQIVDGLIGGKYDEAVGALSMIVNSLG